MKVTGKFFMELKNSKDNLKLIGLGYEIDICNQIIDFAQKQNSIEAVDIVKQYIEPTKKSIDKLELEFEHLQKYSVVLSKEDKVNIIPKGNYKRIDIEDKEFYIFFEDSQLIAIYSIGYISIFDGFAYGVYEINKNKITITRKYIGLSSDANLFDFFSIKDIIAKSSAELIHAQDLKDLDIIYEDFKEKICNIFNVKPYKDLYTIDENILEMDYNISLKELLNVHTVYYDNKIKIILKENEIIILDNLIDLIKTELSVRRLREMIERDTDLDDKEFNEKLAVEYEEKAEKLKEIIKISKDELNSMAEIVDAAIKKHETKK